ncbi:ABC transporter related protein [Acidianus hospitalis W1]|jgi:ABC-2 type transport system ATP-binding protein|uniref:ABC transporter related protein n=1 Tax=Acidianus hospitalis (strain W1) TaxID=933801 RepID=F4B6W4_ACIHW|nr:ABC transporter ATP-binding protein [Acidianus hospitalis]AEE94657.1 ABC transporter related protein [Acidianus hospitalis W1]MDT7901691.1 ABC transporter ATP-binding protein [Acidianus sp.]
MSVIKANNLTKRFGDFEALHGLSFSIEEGSITAVVGPNGAGKSTLLKIISGLIKRTSGEIKVLGEDPWKSQKLPRMLSVILDKPYLPQFLTVEEVIKEATSEFDADYSYALSLVEELNLTNFLKSKIKDLSTGTKQKVQIVFSLIKNPKIIVADEPTANLDVASRFEVYNIFLKLREKMHTTILISSHIASELIAISTHILGINNGVLRYVGEISKMIRKDLLEEFYITVDNVQRAVSLLKSYTVEVYGNQLKVRGNLVNIVSELVNNGVRIFYIRNSILDKSVQGEVGWV